MQKLLKENLSSGELPEQWELVDSLEEALVLEGIPMQMAGFAAKRSGQELVATGSSASWTRDPKPIAFFELLERIAIVEASSQPADKVWPCFDLKGEVPSGRVFQPQIFVPSTRPELWQVSKSNGVAIGTSFEQAALQALAESIERHLVLASWYGANRPSLLIASWPKELKPLSKRYRIESYSFGTLKIINRSFHATGTFLWPLRPEDPVIYGFGAAEKARDACSKSCREAVQRLCFLEGNEAVESEPLFTPRADYHQDFFLHPDRRGLLEKWLQGGFYRKGSQLGPIENCLFVDLRSERREGLSVVRAYVPDLLPLIFGKFIPAAFPETSSDQLIHPVV